MRLEKSNCPFGFSLQRYVKDSTSTSSTTQLADARAQVTAILYFVFHGRSSVKRENDFFIVPLFGIASFATCSALLGLMALYGTRPVPLQV
jgi:hypothetical protein